MTTFEWLLVLLVAGGFLFSIFCIFCFVRYLRTNQRYKNNQKKRPPKNKRKRWLFLQSLKQLEKQKRQQLVWSALYLLVAGCSFASSYFAYDYQQNHLQGEDSQAIVQSYYLLEDMQLQVENIQKGEAPQKSMNNIKEISSLLSSYGARRASLSLKEDAQQILNRYFVLLRELGTNLNSQSVEQLSVQSVSDSYLGDIKKAQESQSQVFERFKVNEGALKKK